VLGNRVRRLFITVKLRIAHTTHYTYDRPLRGECFMEARLQPISSPDEQTCTEFALDTVPSAPVFQYDQPGEMGTVHHFVLRGQPTEEIVVSARSQVETLRVHAFDGINLLAEDWDDVADPPFASAHAEWLVPTPLTLPVAEWPGPGSQSSVFAYGQALSAAIYSSFFYVPGATDVSTPLHQFVSQKRGVCQDYAHLMLACARAQGVPARYVSGYVFSGGDPATHGAGATHAWAELYLPHAHRWVGFDPTNNIIVADHHVKIAVGRDYADVPPTKGLLRGAPGQGAPREIDLEVIVHVEQIL